MTRRHALAILMATLLVLWGRDANAGKGGKGKPGGGDPDPTPAGVVYFHVDGDGYYSMDADGNNRAFLFDEEVDPQGARPDRGVRPSHARHDGDRWFLVTRWTNEVLADGLWARTLLAVREDGYEVTLYNQTGARVRTRAWAKDDSFLSFTIVRPGDGTSVIVRAEVDWTNGAPSIGQLETVVVGSFDTARNVNSIGPHSWSPDGGAVVYAERDFSQAPPASAPTSIHVRDLDAGVTDNLGPGTAPKWSTDGFSIAFGDTGAVFTMAPDGSGISLLTADGRGPEWSPDGEHIIAVRTVTGGKGKRKTTADEIVRILLSGGAERNITSEVTPDTTALAWR